MLDIEYRGGNGIVIVTKKTTVVIDPKLSLLGLKDINVKDAVEIATESRFALNDKDALLNIEGPGEYEIGDFSIKGFSAIRHVDNTDERLSTIYRIEIGEIRLAVIGNIAPMLTDSQLEELGVIDIVILPVGGGGCTLDATSAATLVRQIDPKAVIPVHYSDDKIKYEVPQDSLEVFIKELSVPVEKQTKYKLKAASSLPASLTVEELVRN